jgi:hypothetical protein
MAAKPVKVAVTWIDLLTIALLVVLGMGVWRLCVSGVQGALNDQEPTEEEVGERFQLPRRQRSLTAAEEEWKGTLTQVVQQRLEAEKQTAILAALPRTALGIPEVEKRHLEAAAARDIATTTITVLERRLGAVEAELARRQKVVRQTHEVVANHWKDEQEWFALQQRLAGLALATLIMTGVLFALWILLRRQARRQAGGFHPTRVLAATAVLLFALFGFEAFGTPGLALVSSPLLLGLLLALLNRSPPLHLPDERN